MKKIYSPNAELALLFTGCERNLFFFIYQTIELAVHCTGCEKHSLFTKYMKTKFTSSNTEFIAKDAQNDGG